SRDEITTSGIELKDLVWWPPETNKTVEGYLKQRDSIKFHIDNIKKDYGITIEAMTKIHIPKDNLMQDENNDIGIFAKKRTDTFKSYPHKLTISTEHTDFIVNLVEHGYTINQKKIQEDKMAAAMMADIDIQDILNNKLNYKQLNEYETGNKVYI
ncbi:hypothetical protein GQ472_04450, partial [archaeon]|nr:hypothetical protein [archaeon]